MKKNGLFVLVIILSFFVFSTCTVGLGNEVDIEIPEISITYPDSMAIIRDSFVMEGNVSDDQQVGSVEVLIGSKTFKADIDTKKGTWSCNIINEKTSSGWTFADGDYTATAVTKDAAGRENKVARSFTFDNSMPFVMLERPSTKGSGDSDPYGNDLVFTGSLYDGNSCSKAVIDFYSAKGTNLEKIVSYTSENINQNFEIIIPENVFNVLSETIPEADRTSETKFYYTLAVYDNAYLYKGSGKTEESGNMTDHYYIYDDVSLLVQTGKKLPSRAILSAFDSGLEFSQTRSDVTDSGITAQALQNIRISSTQVEAEKSGTFSINPYNRNPSVKIEGLAWYRGALDDENCQRETNAFTSNEIPGNSSLIITISPGPDNVAIDPETIYVYMLDSLPSKLTTPASSAKITDDKTKASSWSKSGSNYVVTYQIPESRNPLGKKGWYLVVDATDKMGLNTTRRDAESYDYTGRIGYGVYAFSLNGASPYFTNQKIIPGDATKIRPDSDGKITVTVTASDADSDHVKLSVLKDGEDSPVEVAAGSKYWDNSAVYTFTANDPYEFKWVFRLPVSSEDAAKNIYTFMLSDGSYSASPIQRTWTTDVEVPEIISLLKPVEVAKGYTGQIIDYLNVDGQVKGIDATSVQVRGTSDYDLYDAEFWVVPFNADGSEGAKPAINSTDYRVSADVSGADLDDKTFNVYLTMKDKNGNSSEGFYSVWYAFADDTGSYSEITKFAIFVSDLENPTLLVTEPDTNYTKDAQSFTLAGKASDSLGLKSLVINEKKPGESDFTQVVALDFTSGTPAQENWTYDSNSKLSGRWSYTLENPDGQYYYEIILTDISGKITKAEKSIFADSQAPAVTLTNITSASTWIIADSFDAELKVTENGSGIDYIRFRLDDGDWEDAVYYKKDSLPNTYLYKATLDDLTDSNAKTITILAKDYAENEETFGPYTFGVDMTKPVIESFILNGSQQDFVTNANEAQVAASFTLSGSVSDTGSAVSDYYLEKNGDSVEIQKGQGNTFTYTENVGNSTTGDYNYVLYVVDLAGNKSSITAKVKLLSQNPTVSFKTIDGQAYDGLTKLYKKTSPIVLAGSITAGVGVDSVKAKIRYSTNESDSIVTDEFAVPYEQDGLNYRWSYSYVPSSASVKLTGIFIQVTDTQGRESVGYDSPFNMDVTYDTQNPNVVLSSPESAGEYLPKLVGQNITLSGSAGDSGLAGLASIQVSYAPLGQADSWKETVAAERWSYEIPSSELTGGTTYNVKVKAIDKSGNETVTSGRSFIADFETPFLEMTTTDLSTNQLVTISGKAWDSDGLQSVIISDGNDSWTINNVTAKTRPNADNFTKTFSQSELSQGSHQFTIKAVDNAGRSAQANIRVTYDYGNPVFNGDALDLSQSGNEGDDGYFYYPTTIRINDVNVSDSITGIDSVEVMVSQTDSWDSVNHTFNTNNRMFPLNRTNGKWTGSITDLAEGINYIRVVARDTVGNVSEYPNGISTVLRVDTTAPQNLEVTKVTINGVEKNPSDDIFANVNYPVIVTVSALDSGSGVSKIELVKIGSKVPEKTLAAVDNVLTIDKDDLATGTVYIKATDYLGYSSQIDAFRLTVDNVPPSVTFKSPAENKVVNKTFEVSGTVRDSLSEVSKVEVQYSLNNSSWTKIADASITDNTWTVNVPSGTYLPNAVSNENLYLRAIATDSLGNTVAANNAPTLTVKIDQNKDRPTIKLSVLPATSQENATTIKSALTVHGSATDDDGVQKVEISEDGGNTWIDAGANSGVFEFDPANTDDGLKTVMFRLTDEAGGVFTTADASSLKRPYMTSTLNASIVDGNASICYMIDRNNPVIVDDVVNISCSSVAAKEIKPSDKLGPQYENFTLTGSVSDVNGIKSVTAASASTVEASVTATLTQDIVDSTKYNFTIPMTFKNTSASTTVAITITAFDNSDLKISTTKTFVYDRSNPVIDVQRPNKDDLSAGAITIGGSTNDGEGETSGIASVKYMIPSKAQAAGINASSSGWLDVTGTTTWSIDFTTYDTEENKYPLDKFANNTYASLITQGEYANSNVWQLPIFFRVQDGAGNVSVDKNFYITLNPDADKPTTKLIFPATSIQNGAEVVPTVAGTVRITGTAEDNESVKAVYMAVDIDNDSDFDDTDKAWFLASEIYRDSVETFAVKYESDGITVNEAAWWGIKVDNTTSWSKTVNAAHEFYRNGQVTPTPVRFRFRAVDNNDKAGFWTSPQEVVFDPRAAEITEKKLVQYSDNVNGTGNVLAEREYFDDMWIKGKWWLRITVVDSSSLKSVQLIPSQGATITHNNLTVKTLQLNSPIDSENLSGQSISFELDVNNEAGVATVTSFFINFDNTKPAIGSLMHGEEDLDSIVQSNGAYQINTVVTENESNFDRMYMYFVRDTAGKNKRVYNSVLSPLEKTVTRPSETSLSFEGLASNGNIKVGTKVALGGYSVKITAINDDNDTATINAAVPKDVTKAVFEISRTDFTDNSGNSISGFVFLDSTNDFVGIPALQKTVTRSAKNKLSFAGLGSNGNITPGTYVRLGGIDYKISGISGDIATIEGDVDTSHTTAYFIYAAVIDHFAVETAQYSNAQKTSVVNDDYNSAGNTSGDFIAESIERNGTEYTVGAYINSINIPDGEITVYCLAYDIAGNYSVRSKTANIANNGPRISKISLGTDLNGDGTIENVPDAEDENIVKVQEIFEYSVTGGTNVSVIADGTAKDADLNVIPSFTAKDKSLINLEVLNGNGNLYYYLNINGDDITEHQEKVLRSNGEINSINLSKADLSGFDTNATEPTRLTNTITVWDSTEERIVGSTTLKAVANITFFDDVVDGVAPHAAISSFFWNGADDNSLYENSKEYGHIDLAGSWNQNGNDAVSGKIVIRGSASDESRLTSLNMYIDSYKMGSTKTGDATTAPDGALVTVANYTNGAWESVSNIAGFTVTKDTMTQNGHEVEWEYIWDSSLIQNVAQNNIKIHFSAGDRTNTKDAAAHQVDVVPYITGISRPAGTNTYHSSTGRTSVIEGETLTVSGFNFGTSGSWTIGTSGSGIYTSVTENPNTPEAVFTLTAPANSGALTVTKSTVSSNNNNNPSVEYNTEVRTHGDSEDTFRDDRYVYVWNVDHTVSGSSAISLMPTMDFDNTGTIFTTWAQTGKATINLSRGLAAAEDIFVCYDQPTSSNAIGVEKSTGNMGVTFFPDHVGSGGVFGDWGLGNHNIVGGVGFIAVNKASKITKATGEDERSPIISDNSDDASNNSLNPNIRLDTHTDSPYYPIGTHEFARNPGSFSAPQTTRYGNTGHSLYYDETNGALKYVCVPISTDGNDTEAYNDGRMFDTVVIDGPATSYDRQHETSKGTANYKVSFNSTGQNTYISMGTNGGYYKYDYPTVSTSKNGTTQTHAFTVNGKTVTVTFSSTDERDAWKTLYDSNGASMAFITAANAYDAFPFADATDCENVGTRQLRYTFADAVPSCNSVTIWGGHKTLVAGGSDTSVSTATSAGEYSSIDVTSTGVPVIMYKAGNKLRLAYTTSTTPAYSDWKVMETGLSGGLYISMKIDSANNDKLHAVYKNGSKLMYVSATRNTTTGAYTFAEPEVIDTNGSLTMSTLSLFGNEPVITYLNSESSEDGIKYAKKVTLADGTTVWDYSVIPAVVSGGTEYYVSPNNYRVYVGANAGNWSATQDKIEMSNCEAFVGFKTTRVDVVFLKKDLSN